jgi:hypothetical protein
MNSHNWIVLCAVGLWIGGVVPIAASEETDAPRSAAKPSARQTCRCQGDQGPAADRIRTILMEPLKSSGLEFTDEPLVNVVNFLQDEYDIPIQLDAPAFEDAGMTTDEPLHVNLRNVSLKSALRLMLKTKTLTYVFRDEVLLITTPEEAESELVACVYDVRDLIGANAREQELHALADVIVSCVATESWAKSGGGEAQIKPIRSGLLVVSQTQAVHEEIGELLSLIRSTLQETVNVPHEAEEGSDDLFGSGGMGMEGGMSAEEGMGMGGEMGAGRHGETRRAAGGEAADPFE